MTKLTSILFAVPLIASLGPMTIQPLLASAPSTPQASRNNLGNLDRTIGALLPGGGWKKVYEAR